MVCTAVKLTSMISVLGTESETEYLFVIIAERLPGPCETSNFFQITVNVKEAQLGLINEPSVPLDSK